MFQLCFFIQHPYLQKAEKFWTKLWNIYHSDIMQYLSSKCFIQGDRREWVFRKKWIRLTFSTRILQPRSLLNEKSWLTLNFWLNLWHVNDSLGGLGMPETERNSLLKVWDRIPDTVLPLDSRLVGELHRDLFSANQNNLTDNAVVKGTTSRSQLRVRTRQRSSLTVSFHDELIKKSVMGAHSIDNNHKSEINNVLLKFFNLNLWKEL